MNILKNFSYAALAFLATHSSRSIAAESPIIKVPQVEKDIFITAAGQGDLVQVQKSLSCYPTIVDCLSTEKCVALKDVVRHATYNDQEICIQIIDKLLKARANINYPNKVGYTALMIASERGLDSIVTFLVKNGADILKKNKYGINSWSLASDESTKDAIIKGFLNKKNQ